MTGPTPGKAAAPQSPESLVFALRGRLRRHLLWDAFLLFLPPFGLTFYLFYNLYRLTLMGREVLWVSAVVAAGAFGLGVVFLYRPRVPSIPAAGRLVDGLTAARERFLTLVTFDASLEAPALVDRLRAEAGGFAGGVSFAKAFPYRLKRSFLVSLIACLIGILVSYLFLSGAAGILPQEKPDELVGLIRQLAKDPRYATLARDLEATVAELRSQDASNAHTQSLIEKMLASVESERSSSAAGAGEADNLLSQMAVKLRDRGGGGEREKGEGGGSGGLQSPGLEGAGAEKEGSAPGRAPLHGQQELSQGKDSRGSAGALAKLEGPEQGAGPRPERSGSGPGKGSGSESGRTKPEGAKSQGATPRDEPAERYLKPGERGEALQGARFVTVELPEEKESSSASRFRDSERKLLQPKVPVSNAPLPPSSGAGSREEKQAVPLEYRSLIR